MFTEKCTKQLVFSFLVYSELEIKHSRYGKCIKSFLILSDTVAS